MYFISVLEDELAHVLFNWDNSEKLFWDVRMTELENVCIYSFNALQMWANTLHSLVFTICPPPQCCLQNSLFVCVDPFDSDISVLADHRYYCSIQCFPPLLPAGVHFSNIFCLFALITNVL